MYFQEYHGSFRIAILVFSSTLPSALMLTTLVILCAPKKEKAVTDQVPAYTATKISKESREGKTKTQEKLKIDVKDVKDISSGTAEKPGNQLSKDVASKESKSPSKEDSFDRLQPLVVTAKRYAEIADRRMKGRPKEYDTLEGLLTDEFEEPVANT
ncbi:hypothetical protein RB195_009762 [Necator americanus]|uniref:Uncharacterized protein n=1 Tax=Necator americanus TaxID=51031 RepID=A0ABR1CUV9_NECAM